MGLIHVTDGYSYVYMLLCQDDDGPVYIKIGITDGLTSRFRGLRTGCPVRPRILGVVPRYSRELAFSLEQSLLAALDKWRIHGEWFKVKAEEKQAFKECWSKVLIMYSTASVKLKWQKISLAKVDLYLKSLATSSRRRFKRAEFSCQTYESGCKHSNLLVERRARSKVAPVVAEIATPNPTN